MPILEREVDLYPYDLFELAARDEECGSCWWVLYTLSRREKQLMRKLHSLEIPFYGPTIERRYRSPNNRLRTSYEPLFSNYVFVHGDESQRFQAISTNCVSRWMPVPDGGQLTEDLHRIQRLIEIGCPLTPESRLVKGDPVRIRTGVFAGFEGVIIRRHRETRLLVAVSFTQQGASVLLDDCQVEPI